MTLSVDNSWVTGRMDSGTLMEMPLCIYNVPVNFMGSKDGWRDTDCDIDGWRDIV